VRSYHDPHISVVIPCGPGHQKFLPDALDSLTGQTFQNFECVVANDTGKPLDVAAMGHPWVRVIDVEGGSPAAARNAAIAAAKAPLIVPLDADDLLYPDTLFRFYETWVEYPDSIVYGNCDIEDTPGILKSYVCEPWIWETIQRKAIYQNVILFAKQWWEAIGGYPTDIDIWEDWLFGLTLHHMGIGATCTDEPWGIYRHWTQLEGGGSKSQRDAIDYGTPEFEATKNRAQAWIARKEEELMCIGCGSSAKARRSSRQKILPPIVNGPDVVILCERPQTGEFSVNSKAVRGRKYRFAKGYQVTVPSGDAWIATMKGFSVVQPSRAAPAVELPVEPPKPPEIKPPAQQKVPVFKVMEKPKPVPVTSVPEGLDVLAQVERITVKKLLDAGFKSLNDVRMDIMKNAGRKLLGIKGVGASTVARMGELVFD